MVVQLLFGINLESTIGTARMLILYLVSGMGGNLLSTVLTNPNSVGIGASTSIAGIIGAYLGIEKNYLIFLVN